MFNGYVYVVAFASSNVPMLQVICDDGRVHCFSGSGVRCVAAFAVLIGEIHEELVRADVPFPWFPAMKLFWSMFVATVVIFGVDTAVCDSCLCLFFFVCSVFIGIHDYVLVRIVVLFVQRICLFRISTCTHCQSMPFSMFGGDVWIPRRQCDSFSICYTDRIVDSHDGCVNVLGGQRCV